MWIGRISHQPTRACFQTLSDCISSSVWWRHVVELNFADPSSIFRSADRCRRLFSSVGNDTSLHGITTHSITTYNVRCSDYSKSGTLYCSVQHTPLHELLNSPNSLGNVSIVQQISLCLLLRCVRVEVWIHLLVTLAVEGLSGQLHVLADLPGKKIGPHLPGMV
jgi:hypothetical protein